MGEEPLTADFEFVKPKIMITRPPGPEPKFFVGSLLEMKKDPLLFYTSLTQNYGDISYFKLGPKHCYFINNPDYVKEIFMTHYKNFVKGRGLQVAKRLLGDGLLTSEGEYHRRQRRMAQPAFHHQRLTNYAQIMVDFTEQLTNSWKEGATVDMNLEMMRVTLNIVAKTLFSADVDKDASEVAGALTETFKSLDKLITLPMFFEYLPLPVTLRFKKAKNKIDRVIYRIIEARRKTGDTGDLLSMLMHAVDEEGDGGQMTSRQLRDEVMTFFLAGHETTANVLTWMWYLISQNPEVEQKLYAEVGSVLENGRAPTLEDFRKLPYCSMVFNEALRLYPPVWVNGRININDYQVGGYTIPKNSLVFLSAYVMQRDARYFANPTEFKPERWTDEEEAKRPKFSFFAFGGGPRVCAGEQFAWMEAVLVMASVASKWKMNLVPGQNIRPQVNFTLRPEFGVKFTLHKRT